MEEAHDVQQPARSAPQPERSDESRATIPIWGWIPILLALAVVAAVIAMMYPRTATERVGDTTNTGPSMQTVTPAPSPSTSAVVPTPNPTTEPRPTQAPQP
jgi:hypothetical protein